MLLREENSNILTKKREKEMVIMWVMKVLTKLTVVSFHNTKVYHISHCTS